MAAPPPVAAGNRRPTATALLCELTKLRSQQKYLDAGGYSGLDTHDATNHQPDADVRLIRSTLDEAFQRFRRTAHDNLSDCRRQLHDFVRLQQQRSADDSSRVDMRTVRDEVVRLDRLIADLQAGCDVRQLRAEYAALLATSTSDDAMVSDALLLNEMAVKPWPSSAKTPLRTTSSCTSTVSTKSLPTGVPHASASDNRDVRRFLDLLVDRGGHTGGWSDPEHQLYVRAKAKCAGSASADLVASVRSALRESKQFNYAL